jgi:glycosyltransferase involved in cell wall biosynthesis
MKSISDLVRADIPEDIDLIFIGDDKGADTTSVEELSIALNTKRNIYHIGSKYDQDKVNALFSADAVIVPSKHEPFGIVGLEALAAKTLLISSFSDGMNEYLNKDIAINCGKTKRGIEEAIHKIKKMKENERNERIINGYEMAKKFDWDNIAEKYYDLYHEISKEKFKDT